MAAISAWAMVFPNIDGKVYKIMKHIICILAAAALFVGCASRHHETTSTSSQGSSDTSVGATTGTESQSSTNSSGSSTTRTNQSTQTPSQTPRGN